MGAAVTIYGDDCTITPGLIRGKEYSYLTESKTALFVRKPMALRQRGVSIFFLGVSLSAAIGIWLDERGYALMFPSLFIAVVAAISLARSFGVENVEGFWRLFVGSGEEPIVIYSSSDVAAFEAKRDEIERALLGRPLNEEN